MSFCHDARCDFIRRNLKSDLDGAIDEIYRLCAERDTFREESGQWRRAAQNYMALHDRILSEVTRLRAALRHIDSNILNGGSGGAPELIWSIQDIVRKALSE